MSTQPNDDTTTPILLSTADIARMLRIDRQAAWSIAKDIGCIRLGRRIRVYRSDLEVYLQAHREQPRTAQTLPGRSGGGRVALVAADPPQRALGAV